MFTPDGRVREDFIAPPDAPTESPSPNPNASPSTPPGADTEELVQATAASAASAAGETSDPVRLELPGSPPGLGPTFLDLVGVLAEPVPFYLGDAALPDGKTMLNLDMARLHIDLLDVLRQRTAGNLSAEELGVVEDLLYQLRMRYVQKRG